MKNKWINKTLYIILLCIFNFSCAYSQQTFAEWKSKFANQLSQQNIPFELIQQFYQITPYSQAIKSDNNQSEFKKFLWDYLSTAVSSSRIRTGKIALNDNLGLLSKISRETGVAPQYLLGIWGLETNFGQFTGNVPVVAAMSTLAFEGRRRDFFEKEIITLLKLIEKGDIPSFYVKGSWAGGLGLTQFIPTSYQRYAVDFNQDGRRNLWQVSDALASSANYLKERGWKANQSWGQEVTLPRGFNYLLANDRKRSLSEWLNLGIRSANKQFLSRSNKQARLFVPAGQFGPKFLLFDNFDIIKTYNNSDAYALGVSLLGDRILNKPKLSIPWPNNAYKMTKSDLLLLQNRLNDKGFDAGKADGIFGNKTRRAIQSFQAENNLVADGFITQRLFHLITQ